MPKIHSQTNRINKPISLKVQKKIDTAKNKVDTIQTTKNSLTGTITQNTVKKIKNPKKKLYVDA